MIFIIICDGIAYNTKSASAFERKWAMLEKKGRSPSWQIYGTPKEIVSFHQQFIKPCEALVKIAAQDPQWWLKEKA